ncbi:hypothetical protein [Eilatimonas milleporae]|uniref:Uncharacterized protein n=1 Tax=Eilatimonas milleporae TaxID=911205 RepID=A0A3M0D7V4_9PROT|nr:hypothetical protein [Eilatimonas milleporae]RMB12353.1 hypothetical protein BXY39_0849 [Eilatimonas milleporae]
MKGLSWARRGRVVFSVMISLGDILKAVGATRSYVLIPLLLVLLSLALVIALLALTGPLAPFVYPIL